MFRFFAILVLLIAVHVQKREKIDYFMAIGTRNILPWPTEQAKEVQQAHTHNPRYRSANWNSARFQLSREIVSIISTGK